MTKRKTTQDWLMEHEQRDNERFTQIMDRFVALESKIEPILDLHKNLLFTGKVFGYLFGGLAFTAGLTLTIQQIFI